MNNGYSIDLFLLFCNLLSLGARCVATLLHEMKRRGKDCRYGVVSMCIGTLFFFLPYLKGCLLFLTFNGIEKIQKQMRTATLFFFIF